VADGTVHVERRGGAAWVTLDRPPLNLLVPDLLSAIRDAFQALARDPGVRAAVVTGAGRATTGGMQVQVLRALDPASAKALITLVHEAIHSVHEAPFPTVCMINGACLGAGFELAMACDLRVASTAATLGLPEVRVGILPGAGGTQRMARMLGQAKALELMLLGNTVDSEEAARLGLVHRAVPPDRVLPEALALANELAQRPRTSLAEIKRCVYEGVELPLEEALRFEQDAFNRTMRSDDASKLMKAYLTSARPLNEQ
jgi:enoyl-CoA hydratase/carnithine racemase